MTLILRLDVSGLQSAVSVAANCVEQPPTAKDDGCIITARRSVRPRQTPLDLAERQGAYADSIGYANPTRLAISPLSRCSSAARGAETSTPSTAITLASSQTRVTSGARRQLG